ncbi:hypothetical protein U1Q18_016112 [Sarracenia purpurea var. burkii]
MNAHHCRCCNSSSVFPIDAERERERERDQVCGTVLGALLSRSGPPWPLRPPLPLSSSPLERSSAPCAPDLVLLLCLSTPDLVLLISKDGRGGGTVVEGDGGTGTVAPSSSYSSFVATARVVVGSLRTRSGSPHLPKHTRSGSPHIGGWRGWWNNRGGRRRRENVGVA